MGRILLGVVVAAVLVGLLGWWFDLFGAGPEPGSGQEPPSQPSVDPFALGEPLYEPIKEADRREFQVLARSGEPIVMSGVLDAIDKVDIGSAVGGEILYIGDGVPEGATQIAGLAPFVCSTYRTAWITQGGRKIAKFYKPLGKNSKIHGGQMVGELDYARALNNYLAKAARYMSKLEEYNVALRIDEVAQERLEIEIKIAGPHKTRDLADAKLTRIKTRQEAAKAYSELQEAEHELDSAKILLELHEIRPKRPFKTGYIKTIYKDTGEAVKELESVLSIYSIDHLRADGFVES
ncbi:MAG: hypothetical protein NZO58_13345, partial [Gemmataceae bacterium]|nr:hypothetical protein [Gemmataceae bacterium]